MTTGQEINEETPLSTLRQIYNETRLYQFRDSVDMAERFLLVCSVLLQLVHRQVDHGAERIITNADATQKQMERCERWLTMKARRSARVLHNTQAFRGRFPENNATRGF